MGKNVFPVELYNYRALGNIQNGILEQNETCFRGKWNIKSKPFNFSMKIKKSRRGENRNSFSLKNPYLYYIQKSFYKISQLKSLSRTILTLFCLLHGWWYQLNNFICHSILLSTWNFEWWKQLKLEERKTNSACFNQVIRNPPEKQVLLSCQSV